MRDNIAIAKIAMNMTKQLTEIQKLIPDGKDPVLKPLAVASIMLALFMKEIYEPGSNKQEYRKMGLALLNDSAE